jgi:hypothetical protein
MKRVAIWLLTSQYLPFFGIAIREIISSLVNVNVCQFSTKFQVSDQPVRKYY